MQSGPLFSLALLSVLAIFTTSARAQFTTLVQIGDPVPATDLAFADLDAPVIGDDGDIAFVGTLEGTGVTSDNDTGVFVYQAAGTMVRRFLVVREGETLPSAAGPVTGSPEFRLMAGQRLAMRATFVGPSAGYFGVWTWGMGDAAPTPGAIRPELVAAGGYEWGQVNLFRASASGNAIYFTTTVFETDTRAQRDAVAGGPDGTPSSIALVTGGLPDPGPAYSNFSINFRASGSGNWAISADVQQTMPTLESFRALIVDGAVAMREGDMGLDGFQVSSINDAGRVLFIGLVGAGAAATRSLWAYDASTGAVPLARPGDDIPVGMPGVAWANETFTAANERIFVGGGGHVLVKAQIDGAPAARDTAVVLFADDLMSARLIAREGDDAPGLPGVTFASLDRPLSSVPNTVAVNAQGNALVRAELAGDGVDRSNDDSLWGYDFSEDARVLLLRTGQMLLVSGVPHVLTGFDVQLGSGGQDGLRTGYADGGQIALILRYEPVGGGTAITTGGASMGGMPILTVGPPGSVMGTDGGVSDVDGGGTSGVDGGRASGVDGGSGGGGGGGCGGCDASGASGSSGLLAFVVVAWLLLGPTRRTRHRGARRR